MKPGSTLVYTERNLFIQFWLLNVRGCPKAYHPACIKRDEAFFRSKAKWNCGMLLFLTYISKVVSCIISVDLFYFSCMIYLKFCDYVTRSCHVTFSISDIMALPFLHVSLPS